MNRSATALGSSPRFQDRENFCEPKSTGKVKSKPLPPPRAWPPHCSVTKNSHEGKCDPCAWRRHRWCSRCSESRRACAEVLPERLRAAEAGKARRSQTFRLSRPVSLRLPLSAPVALRAPGSESRCRSCRRRRPRPSHRWRGSRGRRPQRSFQRRKLTESSAAEICCVCLSSPASPQTWKLPFWDRDVPVMQSGKR